MKVNVYVRSWSCVGQVDIDELSENGREDVTNQGWTSEDFYHPGRNKDLTNHIVRMAKTNPSHTLSFEDNKKLSDFNIESGLFVDCYLGDISDILNEHNCSR
jgi:hypothetical protein